MCAWGAGNCDLEIEFHNAIDFQYLTIVKRQRIQNGINIDNEFYNNACLILDDNEELCTTNGYGFDVKSNSAPYEIDFILPKKNVKKVKLMFRETEVPPGESGNYHAQIADLKIHYSNVHETGKSFSRLLMHIFTEKWLRFTIGSME